MGLLDGQDTQFLSLVTLHRIAALLGEAVTKSNTTTTDGYALV
jgi:hypothetical protein